MPVVFVNQTEPWREYALTAGELGSSSAQTVMVALLPVLLAPHAPSAVWIGGVVATEGLCSLAVPYLIGALSDNLPSGPSSRCGRRSLFLVLTAPIMALALVVVPVLDGFWQLAVASFAFFVGFNAYVTALRVLIVDVVPSTRWGRVQGFLGALHAGGLAYGLVAAGLLFALWRPLPFLTAAALVLALTAVTYVVAQRLRTEDHSDSDRYTPNTTRREPASENGFWRELLRRGEIGWYLLANALWTGAVDGLRPFIFLFAAAVLGIGVAQASLLLMVLLGGAAIGAIIVGRLGDSLGRGRVLLVATLVTGTVMMAGVAIRSVPAAIAVLVPAGLGAAALMTLPFPVYAELSRREQIGRFAGVFGMSLGAARFAAPVAVGLAIDAGTALFPAERGYPMMWPIVGAMALLSGAALYRANRSAGGALLRAARAPRSTTTPPAPGRESTGP